MNFFTILKYILIGLIQGIGEILPISSSGHMIVIQTLLNINNDNLTYEVFLHFASLLALIIFFRKKIFSLIKSFLFFIFKKDVRGNNVLKQNFWLSIYIIIATIPAAIIGYIFGDIIELYFSKMWIVGILFLVTSLGLFISSKIKTSREIKDLKWYDSLFIGLSQILGILPGISRSGSCIIGGAFRKLKKEDAAEFAFLLAVPIMIGSTIVKIKDITYLFSDTSLIIPYIISFIVTFASTYYSLVFFFKVFRKQEFTIFSVYLFFIGVFSVLLGLVFYK